MKKMIIGALVASLILFFWQFFSWNFSGIHDNEMQHTGSQDAILELLSNSDLEEGTYFLPNSPKGTSSEEAQKFMEESEGKPWATISYYKEMKSNMGLNMFRGWSVNFIAALFLAWILLQFRDNSFKKSLLASLAAGMLGFLTVTYLNSIWFEACTIPALIDVVASWGLVGAWYGWWLNR